MTNIEAILRKNLTRPTGMSQAVYESIIKNALLSGYNRPMTEAQVERVSESLSYVTTKRSSL